MERFSTFCLRVSFLRLYCRNQRRVNKMCDFHINVGSFNQYFKEFWKLNAFVFFLPIKQWFVLSSGSFTVFTTTMKYVLILLIIDWYLFCNFLNVFSLNSLKFCETRKVFSLEHVGSLFKQYCLLTQNYHQISVRQKLQFEGCLKRTHRKICICFQDEFMKP